MSRDRPIRRPLCPVAWAAGDDGRWLVLPLRAVVRNRAALPARAAAAVGMALRGGGGVAVVIARDGTRTELRPPALALSGNVLWLRGLRCRQRAGGRVEVRLAGAAVDGPGARHAKVLADEATDPG